MLFIDGSIEPQQQATINNQQATSNTNTTKNTKNTGNDGEFKSNNDKGDIKNNNNNQPKRDPVTSGVMTG